jgi:hypothetical protein
MQPPPAGAGPFLPRGLDDVPMMLAPTIGWRFGAALLVAFRDPFDRSALGRSRRRHRLSGVVG